MSLMHEHYRVCYVKILSALLLKEPVVLTRHGQQIVALISIEGLQLFQMIEQYPDIQDAKKALEEPGKNIPADTFWKESGL